MRLAIFSLCLLCSACVFHEEYPSHWSPTVDSATECPDIAGTYEDVGEITSSDSTLSDMEHRLSEFFLEAPLEHDAKLTISHPDSGSIQANIHGSNQSHTLSLAGGDYSCKDGKIWWSAFGAFDEPGLLAIVITKDKIGFAKAEDGSLVGELQSSAGGLALVIVPVVGSIKDYVKWKVADDGLRY